MKKENNEAIIKYIFVGLVILLILIIFIIFTRNYIRYNNTYKVTRNPFDSIEVLGEKIRTKENVKSYTLELDCSSLKGNNEQIIYYRLKDSFKDSNVSVVSTILSGDKVIKDNFEDITNISININVKPKNKIEYEQIYNINATCKNIDTQTEETKKDSSSNDNKEVTKRVTKKTSTSRRRR